MLPSSTTSGDPQFLSVFGFGQMVDALERCDFEKAQRMVDSQHNTLLLRGLGDIKESYMHLSVILHNRRILNWLYQREPQL